MTTASVPQSCGMDLDGSVTNYAPAKLNLCLAVLGRRPDGYHEIDTVMAAVTLFDEVTLHQTRSPSIQIESNWSHVPSGAGNLIYHAAEVMGRHAGITPCLHIRLRKSIPMGSGLGGGSSDAAAAMKSLNRLWDLNWPMQRLAEIGAEVGSDVPFFFFTPWARCRGRGERVEPYPGLRPFWAVIVVPGFAVSTAEVYRAYSRRPAAPRDADLHWPQGAAPSEVADRLFNMLEPAAREVADALSSFWHRVETHSRCSFRLAGSGSALFALADDQAGAEALAATLSSRLPVRAEAVCSCPW